MCTCMCICICVFSVCIVLYYPPNYLLTHLRTYPPIDLPCISVRGWSRRLSFLEPEPLVLLSICMVLYWIVIVCVCEYCILCVCVLYCIVSHCCALYCMYCACVCIRICIGIEFVLWCIGIAFVLYCIVIHLHVHLYVHLHMYL